MQSVPTYLTRACLLPGLLLSALLLLSACSSLDPATRQAQADHLASQHGWTRTSLTTPTFTLAAYTPRSSAQVNTLTVYIEGDGLAWINVSTPSLDPTPRDPLALKLALRDQPGQAVYLARPCQFVQANEQRHCEPRYWTSHRFAPDVIDATSIAIDQLKQRSRATQIRLVGYSGGGAIAALVAAQRNDVIALITVAGNLDHATWTSMHRITPLHGSLNAINVTARLQPIPQHHYVGEKDGIISSAIARAYLNRFSAPRPQLTVVPGFDHHCCWESIWPSLVAKNFDLPDVAK